MPDYTRDTPQIDIQAGESFAVALQANPTTGYQWEPRFDAGFLLLLGREFSPSGTGFGQAGVERFRFKALGAGRTRLLFAYQRPWEQRIGDEAVFQVTIT